MQGKKHFDSKEKPNPEVKDGRVLSNKLSKKGFREEKQRLPKHVSNMHAFTPSHHQENYDVICSSIETITISN